MTLQELFDLLARNPAVILFYFLALPLTAVLATELDRGEHYVNPWKYLYTFVVYAAAIPGLFAITLSLYLFLFEKRSILETDIYTQILPVASMLVTLLFIRRRVNLDRIPGFDKLSGLLFIIFGLLAIMWILDRTRLWVVSMVPFYLVIIIFLALIVMVIFGWRKMANK